MNARRWASTLTTLLLFALTQGAAAENLCFVPSPANGLLGVVDCTGPPPSVWPAGPVGFSTTPAEVCTNSIGYLPISIGCLGGQAVISISSSATSAEVIEGPITDSTLYIWLFCGYEQPFGMVEFGLSGSLEVESVVGTEGFTNVGTDGTHTLVASECVETPALVAIVTLAGSVPVAEPIRTETWGRVKASY